MEYGEIWKRSESRTTTARTVLSSVGEPTQRLCGINAKEKNKKKKKKKKKTEAIIERIKRTKRESRGLSWSREAKILFQATFLTIYMLALVVVWHYSDQWLGTDVSIAVLQAIWILFLYCYPILLITLNP
ncbi:hypothetical protein Y032_0097g2979 [Ancylostoma ceylanicum]|uniref:Uncharacterized protein n=1 Tax=Ancylostoma ceylanicum TaxID=53326 RepID=A0A016TJI6_9BILA|nr:hypothetical protein Y032_0097g2979 [Ancylostoma ceylanicum]